ncbi:MAG: hypothetical protein AB7P49_04135 [Bdellovibrionales bacterium]
MVKKQKATDLSTTDETENIETTDTDEVPVSADASATKKKPKAKSGRKEKRAALVAQRRSMMQTAQMQRKAASRIPRNGEPDAEGDRRLEIKAVGLPVLLRDANPDLFVDRTIMLTRTRQAGSRAGMRRNKKGEAVLAILRPRATEEATELVMHFAMNDVAEFLQAVQRSVRGAKRKNVSSLDINLAIESCGNRSRLSVN